MPFVNSIHNSSQSRGRSVSGIPPYIELLVVGGGGGQPTGGSQGGGGAGGVVYHQAFQMSGYISVRGSNITVSIGAGGANGASANGSTSTISGPGIGGSGLGGGSGGAATTGTLKNGRAGGSGGGGGLPITYDTNSAGGASTQTASPANTYFNLGNAGGTGLSYNWSQTGGGGGASTGAQQWTYIDTQAAGGTGIILPHLAPYGDPYNPGSFAGGGNGYTDIAPFATGPDVRAFPGGGGFGREGYSASPEFNGLTNTGGGAGGWSTYGGRGGSGVIVIRYPSGYDPIVIVSGSSWSRTESGGCYIYCFTGTTVFKWV